MREIALYSALAKSIAEIDNTFSIQNGFVDFNTDFCLGILLKDVSGKYTMLNNKKIQGHNAAIQFIFQSGQTSESYFTTRQFGSKLEKFILSLQNKYITTDDKMYIDENNDIIYDIDGGREGIDILISNAIVRDGILSIGKSADGRSMFSINSLLTYYIGGNNNDRNADLE